MQVRHKSLNLLDFERNQEKDLFLLDIFSDRSHFGGATKTEMTIANDDNDGSHFLNVRIKL